MRGHSFALALALFLVGLCSCGFAAPLRGWTAGSYQSAASGGRGGRGRLKNRRLEGGDPVLTLSSHLLSGGVDGHVNVSWSGIGFTNAGDWIGMWPASTDLALFSAPIKFKYVTDPAAPKRCAALTTNAACAADASCGWYAPKSVCEASKPPSSGAVPFTVQNFRTDVVFVYVSGSIQYPEPICESKPLSFELPAFPQGAHLALGQGGDATAMRVYWAAGALGKPAVKFGTKRGAYAHTAAGAADAGRVYTKADMCDVAVQPAGHQGWLAPPTLLSAELRGLTPGETYFYVYGDDKTGWSEERSFVAAPAPDASRPTVIAAFGDMGNAEPDGASHHSWDFGNQGEIPSLNTTRSLHEDQSVEMVLHIGDISYAVGYMAEWERFFQQIEPVASARAWMVGIGNHEQGWSKSYPFTGTDSGGECGVPYNAHFPFASQDPSSSTPFEERQPWYAFTYGNAAFVQMSTEHDFAANSTQHAWLRRALAAVDRRVTPWLVFSGHRPMYIESGWAGDAQTGEMIRAAVEPLLSEFSVDVAIWGHYHAYESFCPGLLHGKCGEAHGVQHFIIGTGGYDHSRCPAKTTKPMTLCNDETWGYMRMSFLNQSSAKFEFVAGDSGKVLDTTGIDRPRPLGE